MLIGRFDVYILLLCGTYIKANLRSEVYVRICVDMFRYVNLVAVVENIVG